MSRRLRAQAFRRVAQLPEVSVAAIVREVNGHAPLFAAAREESS